MQTALSPSEQDLLLRSELFSNITTSQLQSILPCLQSERQHIPKNTFLFHTGDSMTHIAFLCSGKIQILQEDFWGNRSILEQIQPGDFFGEAFVCASISKLPVSIFAPESAELLLFPYPKILYQCDHHCPFHQQLLHNLLSSIASKNVFLVQKMSHMTKRNTRDKVLSYLSAQAIQQNSHSFSIPFNRQELADFLSVDRSALSAELSRMQKEGLLTFHRNYFELAPQTTSSKHTI